MTTPTTQTPANLLALRRLLEAALQHTAALEAFLQNRTSETRSAWVQASSALSASVFEMLYDDKRTINDEPLYKQWDIAEGDFCLSLSPEHGLALKEAANALAAKLFFARIRPEHLTKVA